MKLLMLKGLPASGKSTYALELAKKPDWKRINKDDLRAMIDGGKWGKDNEKRILETRNTIVRSFLNDFNVVVDDTNLDPKHETCLKAIADDMGANFEIKFFDTDYRECIKRDLKRQNSVGKDVIVGMWQKYIIPRVEWPSNRLTKTRCIIFDIDGTLADMGKRSPYSDKPEEYLEDTLHVDIVNEMAKWHNNLIIFCSGRDSKFKQVTADWIEKHGMTGLLLMRKEGDTRPDWIVKQEILRDEIAPYFNPIAVYDDRDQVCAMWRAQGLRCYQVADGNF